MNGNNQSSSWSYVVEEIKWITKWCFILVAIFFLLQSFFLQSSSTPTTSMYPTVKKGDVIILSKFSYGWNFHSLYFGIRHNTFWNNMLRLGSRKKILRLSKPKPGDIIGFCQNSDLNTKFLKRVVAVEGDKVQMRRGVLYINDKPVKKVFLREKTCHSKNLKKKKGTTHLKKKKRTTYRYYRESLENNISYTTRYVKGHENSHINNTLPVIVPKDFIFAMGDNRDHSDDARGSVGLVNINNIFGKGVFRLLAKSPRNKIVTFNLWKSLKSLIFLIRDIRYKRCLKLL